MLPRPQPALVVIGAALTGGEVLMTRGEEELTSVAAKGRLTDTRSRGREAAPETLGGQTGMLFDELLELLHLPAVVLSGCTT